jgi:hypothetical protein
MKGDQGMNVMTRMNGEVEKGDSRNQGSDESLNLVDRREQRRTTSGTLFR